MSSAVRNLDGDGPSYPAQARPGSPAALNSAQLPRKLACGSDSRVRLL